MTRLLTRLACRFLRGGHEWRCVHTDAGFNVSIRCTECGEVYAPPFTFEDTP